MIWQDLLTKLARRMHNALGRAVVVVVIDEGRDGGSSAHTRQFGPTYSGMEFAAKAVLSDIQRMMTDEGAGNDGCPCCVERLERVRTVLGILEPQGATPLAGPRTTRH